MLTNSSIYTNRKISSFSSERLGLIIATSVLLLLSGGVNILLAYKISSLKKLYLTLKDEKRLGIGDLAQSLSVQSLDGTATILTFNGQNLPTFLYVFSPQCGWCDRNLDNVKLLEATHSKKYRFIGLSLSDSLLEEYIAHNNFSFPIYKNPNGNAQIAFKLGGTPQTIIISKDGKIIKNWHGAYSGDKEEDVERFFEVDLPGVK